MNKPPIIVLEGPDAAGKTTLANYLVRAFNANRFRATWSRALNLAMADYQQSILDNVLEHIKYVGTPFVLDRHWPSEWVYGNVFRALTHVHFAFMSKFDSIIKENGGIYIYCSDDAVTQIERHKQNIKLDHPYQHADYIKILGRYSCWWKLMDPISPIIRYRLLNDGNRLGNFCHDLISDYGDRILHRNKTIRPITIDELAAIN